MSNNSFDRHDEGQELHWISDKEDRKVFSLRRLASVAVIALTIACGVYYWPAMADQANGKAEEKSGVSILGFDFGGIFGSDKKSKAGIPEDEKRWSTLKHSTNVEELNDFIRTFPDSELRKFADQRLRELASSDGDAFAQGEGADDRDNEVAEKDATDNEQSSEEVASVDTDTIELKNEYTPQTDKAEEGSTDSAGNTDAPRISESIVDQPRLVRNLQVELKRVGCDPGRTDGRWGYSGKQALDNYNRYGKQSFDTENPTQAVIDQLRDTQYRVCPDPRSNEATLGNPVPPAQPDAAVRSTQPKRVILKRKPTKKKVRKTHLKQKKVRPKKVHKKKKLKHKKVKKKKAKKKHARKAKPKKKRKAHKKKKKRTWSSCMNEFSGNSAIGAAKCQHLN